MHFSLNLSNDKPFILFKDVVGNDWLIREKFDETRGCMLRPTMHGIPQIISAGEYLE